MLDEPCHSMREERRHHSIPINVLTVVPDYLRPRSATSERLHVWVWRDRTLCPRALPVSSSALPALGFLRCRCSTSRHESGNGDLRLLHARCDDTHIYTRPESSVRQLGFGE